MDPPKMEKRLPSRRWLPDLPLKSTLFSLAIYVVVRYGLAVRFWRSDAWMLPSIWVTALVNVIPTILLMRYALRNEKSLKGMRFNLFTGAMVTALMFVLSSLFTFFIVAYAVPDAITRFSGTPVVELDVAYVTRGGLYVDGCPREVHAPLFERGGTRLNYCAGSNEFAALGKRGVANVYGRMSWFGRHVDYVAPRKNPGK